MVNLRTFDLNLLRVFEAVVQDRSVSKAADRLGLSQPAVSNALNRMRHHFADPLFVRTHDGMEPTPMAQQLAETVLHGLTTIRAGLNSGATFVPETSTRRFTVLMTDVGEIAFLPPALATIRATAPNVKLSIVEFGKERYEELLDSGIADLAVGLVNLADTLESQEIHASPFVVVLCRTNPRLRYRGNGEAYITIEDYLDAPHVYALARGSSGDPVSNALSALGAKRDIALALPHASVLPMIMPGTELVTTVPKVCADYFVASGALCQVELPVAITHNFVRQWWHKRNTNDPGHIWLRRLFADVGAHRNDDDQVVVTASD